MLTAGVLVLAACAGSDSQSSTPDTSIQNVEPATDVEPDASDSAEPEPAPGTDTVPDFVMNVFDAIDAVEDELAQPVGGDVQYFEITSNAQFTNVFVAVDDATAAVAYVYVDGMLQDPAPKQPAEGRTFGRSDVQFDPNLVLSNVSAELPDSTVDAISVYGTGAGAAYVLAASSSVGGFLDIEVGPTGQIFAVDPV